MYNRVWDFLYAGESSRRMEVGFGPKATGKAQEARFKFTIPIVERVADVDAGLAGVATAGSRMATRGRTKILAVDDDPQTLRSIRQALSRAGFVPVVTGEPDEVLQLVDQHEPQLVLLDLCFPAATGSN